MTRMQQVKTAIGEYQPLAVAFLAAKPQNRLFQSKDRRLQGSIQPQDKRCALEDHFITQMSGRASVGLDAMKVAVVLRAGIGVLLCTIGFFWARRAPYHQNTVLLGPAGCRMATDIVEPWSGEPRGSVILIHGLAANKKIMAYLAQAFAEAGLRVFLPDLPGHGRTNEPFSFERAEACTESFLRELMARGVITSTRTILAGHSMGGAIAIRIAARLPVAAVIVVSPAPMRATHGIPAALLPFHNPPLIPPETLVISASFEPLGIREAAQDLITTQNVTSKYLLIPHATHVSVLFDRRVASAAGNWAAEALHLPRPTVVPSLRMLTGFFLGFAGILFLAGLFLRAILARLAMLCSSAGQAHSRKANVFGKGHALLEVAVASPVVITVLKFWVPLSFVRLFNGAYFGSFLLLLGMALLLLHFRDLRAVLDARLGTLLASAFAGLALHLAVSGWFDATLSETWLTPARWLRFPVLLGAALPYLLWEESCLEPTPLRSPSARLLAALSWRLIAGMSLMFGIFVLHSGAILLFLLSPYLAVFSVLHRLGMDVVRKYTGSVAATTLFGAILLAGFCLMIFPVC